MVINVGLGRVKVLGRGIYIKEVGLWSGYILNGMVLGCFYIKRCWACFGSGCLILGLVVVVRQGPIL